MSELYHAQQLPLFVLEKVCSKCGIEQAREEFSLHRTTRDGLTAWCRSCRKLAQRVYNRTHRTSQKERDRARYAANPERHHLYHMAHREHRNAQISAWIEAHPENMKEAHGRRRAREQSVEVGKVNYRAILEHDGYWCYICEQDIDPALKGHDPGSLSFDHVIPLSRGGSHTNENIRPTHLICNRRKGSRLLEEMRPYQRWGYDF